ncbi:hypothetical protein FRC04_000852 [Tulasnella sp. 424]|nr:hypothetical protein FRC04_000852 [Tulasnella sp. 424]
MEHKYTKAITLYSEALQIYSDTGNREGRVDPLWGLADVHQVRSEAIMLSSKALQIRTKTSTKMGQGLCLLGLADIHWLQNEYSEAEAVMIYSEVLQIYGHVHAFRAGFPEPNVY